MGHILIRNFCFDVNGRFESTSCVTLCSAGQKNGQSLLHWNLDSRNLWRFFMDSSFLKKCGRYVNKHASFPFPQDQALPDGGERRPPPSGRRGRRREFHVERQLHAAAVVKISKSVSHFGGLCCWSLLILNTNMRALNSEKFSLEFYCVNSLKQIASRCSLTRLARMIQNHRNPELTVNIGCGD